jgi:predicted HTH transcriptional regulator
MSCSIAISGIYQRQLWITEHSFGKKAVRRNPIITNLLQRCNFVENMGTGINKIKDLCADNDTENKNSKTYC